MCREFTLYLAVAHQLCVARARFDGDIAGFDMDSQLIENVIFANWLFSDELSGILTHEIAVGTSCYGTDVLDWRDVGKNTSFYAQFLKSPLKENTTYYTSVRAFNGAGLSTDGCTDGFQLGRAEILATAEQPVVATFDRVLVTEPTESGAPNTNARTFLPVFMVRHAVGAVPHCHCCCAPTCAYGSAGTPVVGKPNQTLGSMSVPAGAVSSSTVFSAGTVTPAPLTATLDTPLSAMKPGGYAFTIHVSWHGLIGLRTHSCFSCCSCHSCNTGSQ